MCPFLITSILHRTTITITTSAGNPSAGAKEVYYTDDGFAMGVAYCLAILKQTRKSDALHWTDTVRAKIGKALYTLLPSLYITSEQKWVRGLSLIPLPCSVSSLIFAE